MVEFPFEKESEAISIIKSRLAKSKNPCVCFSGGKNSLVLLHLVKMQIHKNLQVVHADSGSEFPEVQSYIEKIRKIWKFNLTTIKRENPGEMGYKDEKCSCESWKIHTMPGIFTTNAFDCIFLGNTSDSDIFLMDEFRRHHNFISLIATPLNSFTTEDVWGYIRKYNIPYCSLYNKGYQKIGCTSCSTIDDNIRKNSHKQDDENIMKEKLKKLGYI